jgi:EmrB/QacA subfamily drug resistance transporter
VASVASFMVALDLLVITTALDTIRRELGTSTTALQWTLTAYSVSFAALLMTGAALGDRFGRRRMLAIGLGVFVAGSAAAALSSDVGTLVAARVVQGVGAAFILPLGLTIVAATFPPDRRGTAIGVLEGVSGLAVIAGPLVGGMIVSHLAWEWVFWVNVPIGLLAIPLVLVVVDETHGPDPALDLRGLALVTLAASGVVWGLVRGNEVGWSHPETMTTLAAGVVLAAAFVMWERRATHPLLPIRFFASTAFSAGIAAAFLLSAALYGAVFLMAQFLQAGLGHDSLGAGVRLLPWTATLLVVAPLAGRLSDRLGPRPVLVAGLGVHAAGLGWLALVAAPDLAFTAMVVPLVVAGAGCSAALPVSQAAVVGAVRDAEVGKAAGTNNMLQELGGAFGVAVAVALFAGTGDYSSPQAFTDGFGPAIGGCAALSLLGLVAALSLPRGARAAAPTGGEPPAPGPAGER